MGTHFQTVKLNNGLTKWMKRRCQSTFAFVRDNERVVIYAIDHEIFPDRARAVANAYLLDPVVMIDAVSD
jgi:hypothetical protein